MYNPTPSTQAEDEESLLDEKLKHLNNILALKVKQVVQKHPGVIASSFEDVRLTTVSVKHSFELTTNNPIYQKARRMSPTHNEIVRKEVDRVLAAGIITPVKSSCTSPVVIATKKDGSLRFCVDYRKLNSVMVADRWPLPQIDEILDDMRGISVFTTIDSFQGYWQIKMKETCKDKTAFICRYGAYQFEVMPFGLMNSQATFQRSMDRVLLNTGSVRCYVDDVVIFSKYEYDHITHVKKVFEILEENGLRLRIKKCSFMQHKVELLGHVVDRNGMHVDDHKVDKIKNAVSPTTKKEFRSFLGSASYYRRFIQRFAGISKPLAETNSEKVQFLWTHSMQMAFDTLKTKLTTTPVLPYPDYEKPFIVCTDAFSKAIGAVLS